MTLRLRILESGHAPREKGLIELMELMQGMRLHDLARTLLYRPDFFGTPFNELLQAVLRGPSEWSVAERELFATFTSRQNQCRF